MTRSRQTNASICQRACLIAMLAFAQCRLKSFSLSSSRGVAFIAIALSGTMGASFIVVAFFGAGCVEVLSSWLFFCVFFFSGTGFFGSTGFLFFLRLGCVCSEEVDNSRAIFSL